MSDDAKARLMKALELAEQIMNAKTESEIADKFKQGMDLVKDANHDEDEQLEGGEEKKKKKTG